MEETSSKIPRVSVIIPTYNHQDYVLQTLDSVFAQTFRDYEIIVVNDGSPDDSAQRLEPLAQAGKISYIEQPNAGQAAARNRGLAQARGEFIAFLDDDDLWPTDKLQWQVEALDNNPDAVGVGGSLQQTDEKAKPIGSAVLHERPMTFENLFSGCHFYSPGQCLIRSCRLDEIGGLNEAIWGADDLDLWFRLSRRGEIIVLPRLSLYYRVHPTNASKDISAMLYNVLRVLKLHLAQAPIAKRSRLSKQAYRYLYDYLGYKAIFNLKSQKLMAFSSVLREMKRLSLFFAPALRDPALFRQIISDMTPKSMAPLRRFMNQKI